MVIDQEHTNLVQQHLFGWLDYTLLVVMLVATSLIGLYFGVWGKKSDTTEEYLHGSKNLRVIPVAVSLVVSFLSGIVTMGAPTEIYLYGTLHWLICVDFVLVAIVTYHVYLPVFYDLKITSMYEYLEMRFNRSVRVIASSLWTFHQLLINSVVIYVPALAVSRVCRIGVHIITPVISVICIFYTMLGGIKAVVWTDVLQGGIIVASTVAMIVLGVMDVGGLATVWDRSRNGGRIRVFEMDPSPFIRMTFWSVVIGKFFHTIGLLTLCQPMVQRYVSLPTYSKARTSLVISFMGVILQTSLSCFLGLVIYAHYYSCDPLKSKTITKPDELTPYYIMEVASSLPGLPGIFVSGIVSAALGTMSSSLNSVGATIFEDFVRPCLRRNVGDKMANNIMKCSVVVVGIVCTSFVYVIENLGNILQIAGSIGGVTYGAMVGLFTFGMVFPRGNSKFPAKLKQSNGVDSFLMYTNLVKGALAGSIASMLVMSWVVFGTQRAIAVGDLKHPALPTRIDGCPSNVTIDTHDKSVHSSGQVFILYRISFVYYTAMGTLIMLIVGTIVSLLTEAPDIDKLNPTLFTPFMRKYIEKKRRKKATGPVVHELLEKIHDID